MNDVKIGNLALWIKVGEHIKIGENIEVHLYESGRGHGRLLVKAPEDVVVCRVKRKINEVVETNRDKR